MQMQNDSFKCYLNQTSIYLERLMKLREQARNYSGTSVAIVSKRLDDAILGVSRSIKAVQVADKAFQNLAVII